MSAVFRAGRKTIAVAGTPAPLKSTKTYAYGLKIVALSTNTNPVFLGDSTMTAADGWPMAANAELNPQREAGNDVLKGQYVDLNKVYLDVTTNGEGVAFSYFEVAVTE